MVFCFTLISMAPLAIYNQLDSKQHEHFNYFIFAGIYAANFMLWYVCRSVTWDETMLGRAVAYLFVFLLYQLGHVSIVYIVSPFYPPLYVVFSSVFGTKPLPLLHYKTTSVMLFVIIVTWLYYVF